MQENDERPEGPWKKILLSGGAILTAAAAYNAFARKGVDQLTNLIGGEEGGFEWRDRRVAFTKHGEGPPILLVHGIHAAGWSYEWRNNVDALARTNTVYTLDLLGFGLPVVLSASLDPEDQYQLFLGPDLRVGKRNGSAWSPASCRNR